MLFLLFSVICLAGVALATPVATKRDVDLSTLSFISINSSLPKIALYSTGGTIISALSYGPLDNINYGGAPGPTPAQFVNNNSEVLNLAQIGVLSFPAPGGSAGINSSLFLNVSQYANKQLCAEGSDLVGAVVFHGTNTMIETAIGLDLTVNCSKPVIFAAAMRPDTYISPDGRSNFYQAVAAAVSPLSRDRGAMIAMNDRLTSVYYSTKTNANTPDTFKALEQGFLGNFLGGQPHYYFGASQPTGKHWFDTSNITDLPPVTILYGHQGVDAKLLYNAVENGAKGLVLIGPGPGALAPAVNAAAANLTAQGIPIVDAMRPVSGVSVPPPVPGAIIYSGYFDAEHARVQLQLAIGSGYSYDRIREVFEADLRSAIYSGHNKVVYGL